LDQGIKDPFVDSENIDSPFILIRSQISSVGGARKKHNSNNFTGVEAMVLTDGDLYYIGDTIWTTTKEILSNIEDQYLSFFTKVQAGLTEL